MIPIFDYIEGFYNPQRIQIRSAIALQRTYERDSVAYKTVSTEAGQDHAVTSRESSFSAARLEPPKIRLLSAAPARHRSPAAPAAPEVVLLPATRAVLPAAAVIIDWNRRKRVRRVASP